jgi:hypothetical protein
MAGAALVAMGGLGLAPGLVLVAVLLIVVGAGLVLSADTVRGLRRLALRRG